MHLGQNWNQYFLLLTLEKARLLRQTVCCCLHAKLIFQTFRLLKVASFLMQRKQLCSSSVFFLLLLNGRLRRRRRRHACPYRVEKANFYGSATGIKLCVCWEKNGMEMLRQKIQLMPLLWNVLEGFFLSFFPNKSTRVSMLFLFHIERCIGLT